MLRQWAVRQCAVACQACSAASSCSPAAACTANAQFFLKELDAFQGQSMACWGSVHGMHTTSACSRPAGPQASTQQSPLSSKLNKQLDGMYFQLPGNPFTPQRRAAPTPRWVLYKGKTMPKCLENPLIILPAFLKGKARISISSSPTIIPPVILIAKPASHLHNQA